MLMLDISIDREFNLAYVRTGAGTFGRTIMVNGDINVDLDVNEGIIGVEFLSFETLSQGAEFMNSKAFQLSPGIVAAIAAAQEEVKAHLSGI